MKKELLKDRNGCYAYLTIFLFILVYQLPAKALDFRSEIEQNSQSYIEFKGYVLDSKTNEPLSYADLNVSGTNISTITNTEGEFLLKVPENLMNKKVIVSYLGYKKVRIPLSDFKSTNTRILLDVLVTKLSPISVGEAKNAKALVLQTLKLKGEIYYNKEAIMTAFYRETIKKGRKNASLTEAVTEIYKLPIVSTRKEAVKIIKARKNTNYSRLDTIALKLQGGPYSTLYTDLVKYPDYVFNEDNLSYYDFSFGNSSQINDNDVYVVNFKQRGNVLTPLYYGTLYIDKESLALISADYQLNVTNKELTSQMFVRKKPRKVTAYPTEARYRVDYRVKDGKWHFGYSSVNLTFKVKWKNKLFSSTYTLNSEMVITDWEPNTTDVIRPKESLKTTAILSDEASGFSDPEFWGEYNIIEPEKSIESAIKKISKQLKRNKS